MTRVRNGAEIRRQRLHQLLGIIENHPDIDEDRTKGLFMLKTGLTMKKIEEYLQDLESTGLINRESGKMRRMVS